MKCSNCGYKLRGNGTVNDSNVVIRYLKCENCKSTFKTTETIRKTDHIVTPIKQPESLPES